MNIPARYCTGYLGDIGMPPPYGRWISPPGSRPTSAGAGIRSTPGTTSRASAACSWRAAAMRPTSRSATRSAPTRSPASRSGPTRSWTRPRRLDRLPHGRSWASLTVRHVTTYRYSEPVGFGEHRMMFRPRESHDLRLVNTRLDILPASCRSCAGCTTSSTTRSPSPPSTTPPSELRFDSTVTLEHIETALPDYTLEAEAQHLSVLLLGRRSTRPRQRAGAASYPWDDLGPWAARFLDAVRIDRRR